MAPNAGITEIGVDLVESMIPCCGTQMVWRYCVSSPVHVTVLAANSKDYTTAPFIQNTCHVNMLKACTVTVAGKGLLLNWSQMKGERRHPASSSTP